MENRPKVQQVYYKKRKQQNRGVELARGDTFWLGLID